MADKVTELNELNLAFAERFNARDVDGLMALMAPGVVFVPAPGQALTGEANVRSGLERFLGVNLPIEMNGGTSTSPVTTASPSPTGASPARGPTARTWRCRARPPTSPSTTTSTAGASSSTTRTAPRDRPGGLTAGRE